MAQEIPDWVTSTHPEHTYQLVVFESNDSGVEEVGMTRDEYIALKHHLAAMRGYTLTDARSAVAAIENSDIPEAQDYRQGGEHQIAMHLQTARRLYRYFPEMVVWTSPEFDAELSNLTK